MDQWPVSVEGRVLCCCVLNSRHLQRNPLEKATDPPISLLLFRLRFQPFQEEERPILPAAQQHLGGEEEQEQKRNSPSLPRSGACSGAMAAAAAEKSRKRLRVEATCSICLDLFRDPVTLDCGDNFCQACIEKWWGDAPTGTARGTTCPGCRERVQPWRLKRNKELANMAEILKEMTPEQAGRKVCERHQEPLKLFCKDDEAPICVVCNVSTEHRDHNVVPLQEAAQEHKDRICSSLETLRQEREKILACKADTEKESQALLEQVEAESERTVFQFQQLRQQLHQFLEEQEKLLLAQMDEAGKEIARQRVEHLAKISEKLSSVEGKMQEMEEKRQQPASELLQDIRSTLKKCEENKFEKSVVFSPALKWRIWDVSDKNLFLESFMETFKGTKEGLQRISR